MKVTWLTPIWNVWTEIVGNPPARPARFAQAFAPLRVDGVLPSGVIIALRRYLEHGRQTQFRFVKIEKFADTWTAWLPQNGNGHRPNDAAAVEKHLQEYQQRRARARAAARL